MGIKLRTAKKTGRKLRIAVCGEESVGKTYLGLSVPGGAAAFDCEGRIDAMTDVFDNFQVVEYDPRQIARDFVDAAIEMRSGRVINPHTEQPFGGFLTDSWTTIEKDYVKSLNIDALGGDMTRVRALGDIRKQIENNILNPAFTGPTNCHIVVTAHRTLVWNGNRSEGFKPDATRNFKHYFDLVFYMERDGGKPGQALRRWATVIKSNYQHILGMGDRIENLSWDNPKLLQIINDEAALKPISNKELLHLHAQAGAPEGTLGAWLEASRFALVDRKLAPEDTHRAKGMLESIAEELAELGATA